MNEVGRAIGELRRTYIGNLLYVGLKYSPVAYYIILAMYCIVSLFLRMDRISSLAILPYIYSFIGTAILLVVVLAVWFVASILYHDWRFRSNSAASIVTILIAILMAYLPNTSELYDSVLGPISFQWIDFLLITLSLWEVAVRVFFSKRQREGVEEVMLDWLKRIDDVAIKGILVQSMIMAIPGMVLAKIVEVLDLQDAWIGLSFLALGYLSIALIRWFTMDSQIGFISLRDTLLRKLLEKDLDLYSKEMGIRKKQEGIKEDQENR